MEMLPVSYRHCVLKSPNINLKNLLNKAYLTFALNWSGMQFNILIHTKNYWVGLLGKIADNWVILRIIFSNKVVGSVERNLTPPPDPSTVT